MRTPTFWEHLLLPTPELVAMGVPLSNVVAERFAATGHTRAFSPEWAPTFGGWGRMATLSELAARAEKEVSEVRSYAKTRGLKYAPDDFTLTPAELAMRLWADRGRRPDLALRAFGVLPGERRILCAVAQVLVDSTDGGFHEMLEWKSEELERRFAKLNLSMQPPPELLRRVRRNSTPTSVRT